MPFVLHESLLWLGLPLIGLPVLIHLINLLRHRRVEWAAMEFLLVSQRKHRRWIILKQFLLLLLRMAAVAMIVFMVAQPLLRAQWGRLVRRLEDASHRAVGRQLFDVRPLGQHQRLRPGQAGCQPHGRAGSEGRNAADIHAAAVFPRAAARPARSPTCCRPW